MTTIDKLGRDVGTGFGKPWTKKTDRGLLKMVKSGQSLKEMAARLDCKKQRVRDRLKRLGVKTSKGQVTTERVCLGCGAPFQSEGIGNRMCSACKVRNVCDGRV